MIRRVFLAFLVFGLVGCGVDVTDPGSVAGAYRLRFVDSFELPGLLEIGDTFTLHVTTGSLTLNEDLTCSLSLTFQQLDDGTQTVGTETDACTYALDSGSITVTVPDATGDPSILTGTISDTDVSVTYDEHRFVFRRS